jgi:hypothetical protein
MVPCKAILKARKCLCKGTTAFYFERPHNFEFRAGQFANLTLLDTVATDLEGSTRSLSIASAPYENDLMVAIRNRDTAFKRAIHALPIGSPILFQGPFGNYSSQRHHAASRISSRWNRHHALPQHAPGGNGKADSTPDHSVLFEPAARGSCLPGRVTRPRAIESSLQIDRDDHSSSGRDT